jgi:hypothetical protein
MNIFEALKDNISIALSNATWLHQQNAFELMQAKPYSLNSYTNFDQLYSYLQNPMKKPGT